MTVRLAAALLVMLPACASCFASPIGVLTGPFAGQVLAQQRRAAAPDKPAERKPDQVRPPRCDAARAPATGASNDARPRCEAPASGDIAYRSRTSLDPLPQTDKQRAAD